jgi:hypothetical protein
MITFTMDCENLHHLSGVGGVSDWAFSERSIRGFVDLVEERGYRSTLFLCPETAFAHRSWLPEIESRGHELAMHFHPDSFGDGMARGLTQLGLYPGDIQRKMLTEGIRVWADALGRSPLCFRPGCFSANDETFRILVDLGFRYGSCSSPGRNERRLGAIWQPPLLDTHRANGALRSLPGDLDFVEVPLTVDWEARFAHRFGWNLPQELLIERGDIPTLKAVICKNAIRAIEEQTAVPSICVATHNVWDFSDRTDHKTQCIVGLIDSLVQIETHESVQFKKSTIGSIAQAYVDLS